MDTLFWFQVSIHVFLRYYYSLLFIVFGGGVKKNLELSKISWFTDMKLKTEQEK